MIAQGCAIVGCEEQTRIVRGWCWKHYMRWWQHGDPRVLKQRPPYGSDARCEAEGCPRRPRARGLCDPHYRKAIYYGLSPEQYLALIADGCAVCGTTDPGGRYGVFNIDHDHACCPGTKTCGNCLRGSLCNACNTALGLLKDSPHLLLAAYNYLVRSRHTLELVA